MNPGIFRLKTEGEIPGVGRIASRFWYCPAEIPILSVAKSEEEQTTVLPNGATAKLTRSQELLDWGRGVRPVEPARKSP